MAAKCPLLRLGPTFFGRNGIMITLSEGTKATPTFWGSMLELLPMAPRDSSPCHIFPHKRRFPATFSQLFFDIAQCHCRWCRTIPLQMTAYTNIIYELDFLGPREMCILICHQAEKESEISLQL